LQDYCFIYKVKEQAKIFETFVVVTFSSAGSHFWTGGHIVSSMWYKDRKSNCYLQLLFSVIFALRRVILLRSDIQLFAE